MSLASSFMNFAGTVTIYRSQFKDVEPLSFRMKIPLQFIRRHLSHVIEDIYESLAAPYISWRRTPVSWLVYSRGDSKDILPNKCISHLPVLKLEPILDVTCRSKEKGQNMVGSKLNVARARARLMQGGDSSPSPLRRLFLLLQLQIIFKQSDYLVMCSSLIRPWLVWRDWGSSGCLEEYTCRCESRSSHTHLWSYPLNILNVFLSCSL